jgi:hypothetical protein
VSPKVTKASPKVTRAPPGLAAAAQAPAGVSGRDTLNNCCGEPARLFFVTISKLYNNFDNVEPGKTFDAAPRLWAGLLGA